MFRRNSIRQKGATVVELALSFTVFLLLLVGLMEMGRMVWAYTTIAHATREAARYAMAHGSLNPATRDQILNVVVSNAVGLDADQFKVKTTWDPSNERGNIVEVETRYHFALVTSPLILPQDKIWLSATSRMVIAN